jgi:hypothetical protein
MISRSELQRLAKREKVSLGVLEKDYVLTGSLKLYPVFLACGSWCSKVERVA